MRRIFVERNPNLFIICETKLVSSQCKWWKWKFHLDGIFVVDSNRRSGGLILLWRDPFEVQIRSYSPGHIDCIVKNCMEKWRFTGFYGNPVAALRSHSWQLMRRLEGMQELNSLRWLIGGDFNEILYDSEKQGGIQRNRKQMLGFAEALEDCGLKDIPFTGDIFTWCNRRVGGELILARLDRSISLQ